MEIKFTKMQAFGNDYVYIDAINQDIKEPDKLAKKISDRHFGVGSDGLVLICPSECADFRMRIFNPDGTEGEMCGNAIRSVGKFVYDYCYTSKPEITVETLGGLQRLRLYVSEGKAINITADICEPVLDTKMIPVNTALEQFIHVPVLIIDREFYMTAISWGNPHCVVFIDDVQNFEVEKYGRAIEFHKELFPNRTNVTFAEVVSPTFIKIREWERGTGETIGCGLGCCSAVVAASILGKAERKAKVWQIGGILEADWQEDGRMLMTGPSHIVYEGVYDYEA